MPPNRTANIKRKVRYTDRALRRAMVNLADIYVTMEPQHPELGEEIERMILRIDQQRVYLLDFYRDCWGGTERGLWKPGERGTILEGGKRIRDPKGRDNL